MWVWALAFFLLGGLGLVQIEARRAYRLRGLEATPQPVADTGMNRACVVAAMEQYDLDERVQRWDAITEAGFVWVRQRFDWAQIEPRRGRFDWARWDAIVAEGVARGLQFIAVLDHPPDWAGMPPDPQAFAAFAAAFANHYRAQIVYYQILHNPNLGATWGGQVDAAAYAELLSTVSPAIRAADPDARIILGSLAPTTEAGPQNYAEPLFLEMLYADGAAPYFDVVALQPYGFQTGPEDRRVAPDLLNFSRPLLVHEVMEAHGEGGKAIWASDFGWNSLPPGWDDRPSIWGSVDEATQAAYTVGALERIEREWPWMGVACLNNLQPRPRAGAELDAETHWGFALLAPDGTPRPLYEALRQWNHRPRVATPGLWPAATPYAHYEGAWRLGPLGADIGSSGDRVSFTFRGTDVALTVRRGPYRAFLFVTVDGAPAPALPRDEQGRAYIVLYDPLAAVATVPLAEHLPTGVHTVEVVADRGWYQWSLVDWRVADYPALLWERRGRFLFTLMMLIGLLLAFWAARRTAWREVMSHLRQHPLLWPDWVQWGARLLGTALFSFSAWMSWREGLFRRLGHGSEWAVLGLALLLFYFSPWAILTLLSGVALFVFLLMEPAWGLALTVAVTPFYLHPLSLFGRSFALAELLLLMTVAAFVVRAGFTGGLWRIWPLSAAERRWWPVMAGYLIVGLVASLLAAHRHEALREFRLVIVEPVLFFLLLLRRREWRERWPVLDLWVLGGVTVALVGLVGYFILGDVITAEGGIPRLRSIYGSPNNVALFLGRLLPLLIALALWGEGRRRWVYACAALPIGLAFLLTLSRGGLLLGLPAALMVMGWLAGGRWRKATFGGLLLFAVMLIPLFRTPRFASLFDLRHGTTFLRLSLWRSAWMMFRDHPWLGVGPDNFLYAYRTRYILPSAWEEFNLSHPHNFILDWLTRLGLAGMAIFVWMELRFWRQIVAAARRLRGWSRALALGLAGAMAETLAHGLVDAAFFYIDLAYLFFLLLALAEPIAAIEVESLER